MVVEGGEHLAGACLTAVVCLRPDHFAVHLHVEHTSCSGDQRQRLDVVLVGRQQLLGHAHGVSRIVSRNAVGDGDLHVASLGASRSGVFERLRCAVDVSTADFVSLRRPRRRRNSRSELVGAGLGGRVARVTALGPRMRGATRWKPDARSVALHGRDRKAFRSHSKDIPQLTSDQAARIDRDWNQPAQPSFSAPYARRVLSCCGAFTWRAPGTRRAWTTRRTAKWHNKRSSARRSA